MTDIAIRTEGLSRNFGAVRAVDSLSLEVPAGIVFGFLGPNGAGKTTTIRLLLGLLAPTAGRAEVLGFSAATEGDEVRRRAGALLEHPGLYERLSADDNLEFYARAWQMPPGERKARIRELLTHLGLWDRRKEAAGTWSRGMRQKLAVARALLHRPSIVFLDEPTAGLDPVAAAALRDELAGLASREGVTLFLTTHNLAEAERLCTRVGVIREGKLLVEGPPGELHAGGRHVEILGAGFTEAILAGIRSRPEVAGVEASDGRLLLELRDEVLVAPIVRLIVTAGGEVEEVRKGRASLEEAFLALMEEPA